MSHVWHNYGWLIVLAGVLIALWIGEQVSTLVSAKADELRNRHDRAATSGDDGDG